MKDMEKDDVSEARRKIWLSRGRRLATGLNTGVALVLAGLALVMVNYLSSLYHTGMDMSTARFYVLSDKTKGVLGGLKEKVNVVAFFQQGHELTDDVRNLLKEYESTADKLGQTNFKVEIVDPDRDLVRARELKQEYDLTDPNVVVFESGGRKKCVAAKDIVDYKINLSKMEKKKIAFKGEQIFSSAIQNVTQTVQPVVYFLTGHGERDVTEYNRHSGYSSICRTLRHDNVDVRVLNIAERHGVPDDCSALIIAGPSRKFSGDEVAFLSRYLERKGRIMILLDQNTDTGLEGFLAGWDVKVGTGVAVGLTTVNGMGRELVVMQYPDHPITRKLKNIYTVFFVPRPVEPASGKPSSETPVDRPRVFPLASNTEEGWLETDQKEWPPRYDSKSDRLGSVSIAVAVEKGPVSGVEVELKPSRIVVIGDSLFASNDALKIGGNEDFFMSSANWLLERETLMAISPKKSYELSLNMSRNQMRNAFLLLVAGIPGFVAFAGLIVWFRRRS